MLIKSSDNCRHSTLMEITGITVLFKNYLKLEEIKDNP